MRFLLITMLVGCSAETYPGTDFDEPASDEDTGSAVRDSGTTVSETAPSTDSETPPNDTAVADTTPPEPECYREAWNPSASLADLKSGYTSTKWKTTALEALNRRYPDGFALLDAMKDDADLSRFANPSSYPALMESIDTMCHEEGHGWDFNEALKKPGKHVYWLLRAQRAPHVHQGRRDLALRRHLPQGHAGLLRLRLPRRRAHAIHQWPRVRDHGR
jgi:hypothetical protein